MKPEQKHAAPDGAETLRLMQVLSSFVFLDTTGSSILRSGWRSAW